MPDSKTATTVKVRILGVMVRAPMELEGPTGETTLMWSPT